MRVIYSYDMNCIRIIPPKGSVECIPLSHVSEHHPGKGGRGLTEEELRIVAQKYIETRWPEYPNIKEFRYLGSGKGYMI